MATLSQRLHRLGDNGYDVLHFETESVLVLRPNGANVETALQALEQRVAENAVQFLTSKPASMKPGTFAVVGNSVFLGDENGVPLPLTDPELQTSDI